MGAIKSKALRIGKHVDTKTCSKTIRISHDNVLSKSFLPNHSVCLAFYLNRLTFCIKRIKTKFVWRPIEHAEWPPNNVIRDVFAMIFVVQREHFHKSRLKFAS